MSPKDNRALLKVLQKSEAVFCRLQHAGETPGRVTGGARGPTAGTTAPKPGFVRLGQGSDTGIPHPPLPPPQTCHSVLPGILKWVNPKRDHLRRGCCRASSKPVQIGADYHGVCCWQSPPSATACACGCPESPTKRFWLLKSHAWAPHVSVWPRPRSCHGLRGTTGKLCWWDRREGKGSISYLLRTLRGDKRDTLPFFPGFTGWLAAQNQSPEKSPKGD